MEMRNVLVAEAKALAQLSMIPFQPSFELREKICSGARVTKRYLPASPASHFLARAAADEADKACLRQLA